jgi:quinoprotein glucose dehydrogenase
MTHALTLRAPLVAASLALALAQPAAAIEPAPEVAHRVEVLATGLDRPWAIALLPGSGDILISQRGGAFALWQAESGRVIRLSGAPEVRDAGQGGLLDVALAPEFAETRHVYAAWTAPRGELSTTALGRFRLDLAAGALTEPALLFEAAPAMAGRGHFGARIAFADGHLFLGLGDRQSKDFTAAHPSQDLSSHWGSVVRLGLDGSVPADNPLVGQIGALPEIWSWGHRNIQAMAVHPATGALWLAEHGEAGGDEINIVRRGANYGWPLASHGVTYRGGDAFAPPHRPGDGFEAPVFHWGPGRADNFPPSGMAFYDGAAFPDWQGHLLIGNLAHQYLGLFAVQGETVSAPVRLLADRGWRIRDVAVGPDGFVYGISDGQDAVLFRIVPEGS